MASGIPLPDSSSESSNETESLGEQVESQMPHAEEDGETKMDEEIPLLSAILRYCKKKGQYPFENSASSDDFASCYPELNRTGEDLKKRFLHLDEEYRKLKNERGSGGLLRDPFTRIQFHLWTAISKGRANLEGDPLADYDFLRESPLVSSLPQPFLQESLKLLSRSELKQFDDEWEAVSLGEMKATTSTNTLIAEQRSRIMQIIEEHRSSLDA